MPLVRLLQRVAWLVRQPSGERPAHGVVQKPVDLEWHRRVQLLAPRVGQATGCTAASRVEPAPAPPSEGLDVDMGKPHLAGGEEFGRGAVG